METLPPPNKSRSLTLLGWQASIYWIWNERNQRLHANRFRSVDSLFSLIDHQVRNKIQSFRESQPARCSEMMQLWIRWSWFLSRVPDSSPPYLSLSLPQLLVTLGSYWVSDYWVWMFLTMSLIGLCSNTRALGFCKHLLFFLHLYK